MVFAVKESKSSFVTGSICRSRLSAVCRAHEQSAPKGNRGSRDGRTSTNNRRFRKLCDLMQLVDNDTVSILNFDTIMCTEPRVTTSF